MHARGVRALVFRIVETDMICGCAIISPAPVLIHSGIESEGRLSMAVDDNDQQEGKLFESFAAEARAYAAGKSRELTAQTRFGSTRSSRPPSDRADNPRYAHERHQAENGADQEKRLRAIADPVRQSETRAQVVKHYAAWSRAASKAYLQRFDNSQRIYDRKLAARKVDERLIPKDQKETMRKEAIREAVAQSDNRMKEINTALPQMIDSTINNAVKLSPARSAPLDKNTQRAKDTASAYNARVRQSGAKHPDRDHER